MCLFAHIQVEGLILIMEGMIMVLICSSLMDNVEHLSMHLFGYLFIFGEKGLFRL